MRTSLVLLTLLLWPALTYAVEVQQVKSAGGILALLVEDHGVPMIAVRLAFTQAGSAYDPADKQGLAVMAAELLTEGAGDMDSKTFLNALDTLAIDLSFSVLHDQLLVGMDTLSEHREEAFRLLATALKHPRFDEEPLARVREEMLTALKLQEENPRYLANIALEKEIFGPHPYAYRAEGTPDSLRAVTRDDLLGYATHLRRPALIVAVAGDITAKELQTLLDRHFDTLPEGEAVPALAEISGLLGNPAPVMEKNAAPQTVVMFGAPGITRSDPRFYTYYVMNHMLGGGTLSSRLGEQIRRKLGLAYYAYTQPEQYDRIALLIGTFGTRNEEAGKAIVALQSEWEKAWKDGFTKAELTAAKQYLTGSFALELDANRSIVNYLLVMQLYRLGMDFLEKRNGYIEAVTLADLNALAKTVLNPQNLRIVSVGGGAATPAAQ